VIRTLLIIFKSKHKFISYFPEKNKQHRLDSDLIYIRFLHTQAVGAGSGYSYLMKIHSTSAELQRLPTDYTQRDQDLDPTF